MHLQEDQPQSSAKVESKEPKDARGRGYAAAYVVLLLGRKLLLLNVP